MRKTGFDIVISAFIFLFLIPLETFPQTKIKKILVFFSLSSNTPAYQNILQGLKNTFIENIDEPRDFIVEYLDTRYPENEPYSEHIIEMYNQKFKDTQVDLLITVGPGLNPLLIKYGLIALKTSPVIDIDLDTPQRIPAQEFPNKNRIELVIKINAGKTLENALAFFPENKNVYVITGTSKLDSYFSSHFDKSKKEFEPGRAFKFISGISMDSTIKVAKEIPANSIVIVPIFAYDINNISYGTAEATRLISNNCKAPVFVATDAYMEQSGKEIGGYIFSYTALGKEAGKIATKILNGLQAKDITVDEGSFYQYMYNWRALKKWELLDSNAIPNGSVFYNEDISFFKKYEWYIAAILIFLVTQTVLIVYLFRLNRRQKVINSRMLETENMYREIIREDRLAKMSELTASLSHELNQPLTAILYSAQAGKRFLQTGKLDQKLTEELFDNIVEYEKRAAGIIGSVRSLMKLENREKERLNLNDLIRETLEIINTEAIRNGIKIKLQLTDDPVYVLADKIQLQQVLMNFIKNAFDAMEITDPESKIIEIVQKLNKESVTVSVRDFGHGIADAFRDNLFKPFVTTSKKGFGIGLALSRSIIEKHNGEIRAENVPGGGARFSFSLHIIKNGR